MLAHRSKTELRVPDPSTQRVVDAFIALTLGVSAVGLCTILVHVGFTGDLRGVWAYLSATLAFLVLVTLVCLVALYLVRRPSPMRTFKRRLITSHLKMLENRVLHQHHAERATHGR
jgi:hypothetical protein